MARRLGKQREITFGTSGTTFKEKSEKILTMKVTLMMKVKKRKRLTRIKSNLQRKRKESDTTILSAFSINFSIQEIRFTLHTQYLLLTLKLFMT